MKVLLTGANGYIGKRLLPVLLERGHEVYAAVRDRKRLETGRQPGDNLHILEVDFLRDNPADLLPADLDAAYYLIHSMSASQDDFNELESVSARNFVELIDHTSARQIIYLSGISNAEKLSRHLASRRNVETILSGARISLTNLRAGIIVGSGSASFEIIRDLVEKLPVMVTPKWLNTRCQPIAIRNVIQYLHGVLLHQQCMGRTFDIGGPEILTYREMLLQFAEVRNLKRLICTIPVMTPRLSSYWLYFVTAISYNLAVNLVDSMKVEVVCRENRIRDILNIPLIDYRRSIELAFARIEQNLVLSSWKDAMVSGSRYVDLNKWIEVPRFGCY
ncbi:MAG: epimerase, partial [Bacteroides sp. SM23_62]